jgi:hypothetical protein
MWNEISICNLNEETGETKNNLCDGNLRMDKNRRYYEITNRKKTKAGYKELRTELER